METPPPCASKMQRESPTDATVTVHPSIITNVAVVPEVFPAEDTRIRLFKQINISVWLKKMLKAQNTCLWLGIPCQFSQSQQLKL